MHPPRSVRCARVLGIVVFAGTLWLAPASAQSPAQSRAEPSVRIEEGSEADFPAFLAEREALLEESEASKPEHEVVTRAGAEPSIQFLLPFYRVDRELPFGETTLFALRNVESDPTTVRAHFFSAGSSLLRQRDYQLAPREVVTVNLRDIPGLERGYALLTSLGGSKLAGDFFQVNPGQNFATGGLLVKTEPSFGHLCRLWDIRFLKGGGFSGGTGFVVWVRNAPGIGSDDPVLVRMAYFDEDGESAGMIHIRSSANAFTVRTDFPWQVDFGAVEILFTPESGGGLISGVYRAEDRYSVSVNGTCRVPLG